MLGVFGSGDTAVVIAEVKGKKRRIMLGDTVVGWTLSSVERGEANFVDNGQSQTLALKFGTITSENRPQLPMKTNTENKKVLK